MAVNMYPAEDSAKLLDVQAVANMLDCSVRHVYRLSDTEQMPSPVKLGSLVKWSRAAIEQWVDDGCPTCPKTDGGAK